MITKDNKYFQMMVKEIETIKDEYVKSFALYLLETIPDYFFVVPASSSGKYHPVTDLGEGGLVRHSIAVKKMLEHLMVVQGKFLDNMPKYKDYLIVCALFHDSFKSGTQDDYYENKHTKFLHPVYAANHVMLTAIKFGLDYDDAKFMADAIISHMGQWNTSKNEKGVLPTPQSPQQQLLHLADYLASRKDISIETTDPDEPIDIEIDSSEIIAAVTINEKGE